MHCELRPQTCEPQTVGQADRHKQRRQRCIQEYGLVTPGAGGAVWRRRLHRLVSVFFSFFPPLLLCFLLSLRCPVLLQPMELECHFRRVTFDLVCIQWACLCLGCTSPCVGCSRSVSLINLIVSPIVSVQPSRQVVDSACLPRLSLSLCLSLAYLGQSKSGWWTIAGAFASRYRQFGVSLLLNL